MSRTRSTFNPVPAGARVPGDGADIVICDVTLREGEQTPGAQVTASGKRQLLEQLAAAGVDQAQVGVLPANSDDDAQLAALCGLNLDIATEIMTVGMRPTWSTDLDRSLACGPDVIHSGFFVSRHVAAGWDSDLQAAITERIRLVVDYVHDHGKLVNISFIDASRAEPDELLALVQTAVDADADRIRLCDTAGAATPEGMRAMVTRAADIASSGATVIGVHCHNDFGLAVANTLAGIEAGAGLADVSINGLGDRTGNAGLAEVAGVLDVLLDRPTSVDLTTMTGLSRLADSISHIPTSPRAPLVGAHAFAHEIDIHVGEIGRDPLAFQVMEADQVGNETRILFGTKSGPHSVELMARRHGVTISETLRDDLLALLADTARRRPGDVLDENDFWVALDRVTQDVTTTARTN